MVLAIVGTVATLLILTSISVIAIELLHPETDTESLIRVESEILGVLVGALVGFIGGRGQGRAEARSPNLGAKEGPPIE